MKVKPLDETAKKWDRRASAATPDYEAGIRSPRRPWKGSTLDASDSYAAGVQAAIANNQFARGVERSSDEEWRGRSLTLGRQRYAPGVAASTMRYSKGFAPYHAALSALDLPPRGPRGSQQNYDRSALVGQTLHNIRIGAE